MRSKNQLGFTLAAVLTSAALSGSAAVITNVMPVNVTPSSFTILWRTASSTPSISVYADAAGVSNLVGQLAIEAFPLHTGLPDAAAGYERRQTKYLIREKTQSLGLMMLKVSDCRPNTQYYFRLTSKLPGGSSIVYPDGGPLPSVTTEKENSFVLDAQQLIFDVPGIDNLGRILTLSNSYASHPIAAVVGDGAGTNQAFFSANDLFMLAGQGNFNRVGPQQFTATLLGPGTQADLTGQFVLTFSTNLVVGNAATGSFGTTYDYLAVSLGSALVRAGEITNASLDLTTLGPLSDVDLLLSIPDGYFSGLSLQSLAPELDTVNSRVTRQGTNWLVHLAAASGSSLTGSKTFARLTFTAPLGTHSGFAPLTLVDLHARNSAMAPVTNLFGQSGRVVVLGEEPLVEAAMDGGARTLTLFGKPWSSYAIESNMGLEGVTPWTRLPNLVPMFDTSTTLGALNAGLPQAFYRAVEFFAEPPLLQPYFDEPNIRQMVLFGRPGFSYEIQYAVELGAPTLWTSWLNVSLTNSFAILEPTNASAGFYRVVNLALAGPRLEARRSPDAKRSLLVSGEPGRQYAVEYSTNLSNVAEWRALTSVRLTTSTGTVDVGNTNALIFYRLRQQ